MARRLHVQRLPIIYSFTGRADAVTVWSDLLPGRLHYQPGQRAAGASRYDYIAVRTAEPYLAPKPNREPSLSYSGVTKPDDAAVDNICPRHSPFGIVDGLPCSLLPGESGFFDIGTEAVGCKRCPIGSHQPLHSTASSTTVRDPFDSGARVCPSAAYLFHDSPES